MQMILTRPRAARLIPFEALQWGWSGTTLRVLAVKLTGVLVLVLAVLHFGGVRQKLTEAALDTLIVQADVLTAVISADETRELVTLGPLPDDATLRTAAADTVVLPIGTLLDRNAVERLFAQILKGSDSTARLYGIDGRKLTDSEIALLEAGDVSAAPLGPLVAGTASDAVASPSHADRAWSWLAGRIDGAGLDRVADETAVGDPVRAALEGVREVGRRIDADGNVSVWLTTPITNADGVVVAALELTNGAKLVNALADDYETAMLKVLLLGLAGATIICLIVAARITQPIARLSNAADAVKRGFPYRPVPGLREHAVLGRLDRTLQDMTEALTTRIDAMETFAAEVAHELKNPLTSLRSAAETLPLAKTEKSRDRLLAIIEHDVRRIDRLITGIAETSKLDAELSRTRRERFDLVRLLRTCISAQNELSAERGQKVDLFVQGDVHPGAFKIAGNDVRIGQVVTNLVDNALSFTPEGGAVRVSLRRYTDFVEIVVDDEGPGVKEDMLERIFERFYTDRADRAFGNNSGLGLAICRQIVEAHNGEIFAENRYRTTLKEREVLGARFTVRLPA